MIGAGGLVVVGLSSYFGRLPVIFYFQACALGMGIWCAAAKSYNSYLGARILLGFFASVAEGVSQSLRSSDCFGALTHFPTGRLNVDQRYFLLSRASVSFSFLITASNSALIEVV